MRNEIPRLHNVRLTTGLFPTLILALLAITGNPAVAAEPNWPENKLSIQVQEQPVSKFLQDFFSAIDMKVLIGDSVDGRISGKFDDYPEKIFRDVVKAYGLLPYFDGSVTHVSMASDVRSRSFELSGKQLDQVLKSIVTQGLSDQYQSVHVIRNENLIKVRGAPEFILDVEKIVHSIQPQRKSPPLVSRVLIEPNLSPNQLVFRTFNLKYASATDVTLFQGGREFTIPGVASILRSIVGDGQSPTATSVDFGYTGPRSVPGLRDREHSGPAMSRTDITISPEPDPLAITSSGVITDRPFVTRIEAERNLNAVIVRDYVDAMPIYEQLILQLDQEPNLIEIQVTIIDIDKSKLRDLGVDWQYDGTDTQAQFGGGAVVGQNGGLSLNTVLGDTRRFISRVNALAVSGSADVVSKPQVMTLSNLEAVLASDQSFFVRVAGNEDVDLFNITVGTTLRVIPNVVGSKDDPQIRLLVAIEDGSLTPDAVDDIPIIDKSTLSTQAIIYDGESLLLGGLVRDSTTSDTTGVPVLGKVPVIGRVFKRTTDITTSTERLFLITPRVVKGMRATGRNLSNMASRHPHYDIQGRTPDAYLDGF